MLENVLTTAGIRRYPGMFVGDVHDGFGAAELVYEVVGNALDQALIGEVRQLRIALRPNEAEVLDDGPGISVDPLPSGRTFLEEVATVFHDAPTADGHAPHVHLRVGTDFGLALVSALCEEVEITTRGLRQRFGRGLVLGPAEAVAATVGTRLRFVLDPTIFPPQGWPVDDVADRLKVIAAHVPGLQIALTHEDTRGVTRWELGPYVGPEALLDTSGAQDGWVICRAREATWQADVVLRSSLRRRFGTTGTTVSFANFARTPGHGVHVDGMRQGVGKALGRRLSDASWQSLNVDALVSVRCVDASYHGPTHDALASPELKPLVASLVAEELRQPRHEALRERLRARLDPG